MNILGLSTIGDDCAVSLLANGELVAAANEASLRGAWMAGEFPYQAVETVLRSGRLDTYDIDAVAVARQEPDRTLQPLARRFFADWNFTSRALPTRRVSTQPLDALVRSAKERRGGRNAASEFIKAKAPLLKRALLGAAASDGWLGEFASAIPLAAWFDQDRGQQRATIPTEKLLAGLCEFGWGDKFSYCNSQRSVEASAFRNSGFQRGLIVNFAGDGFDATATVSIADEHGLRTIDTLDRPFSLADFSVALAAAMGWKRHRGPDWVASLAAQGDPTILQDLIGACIAWEGHKPAWRNPNHVYLAWRLINQFAAADIAAAWQAVLFATLKRWLQFHLAGTTLQHLVLCGNLPASDLLAGLVCRECEHLEIYVDPRSLEFAESIGAAALKARELLGYVRTANRNTSGPYFSARELQGVLSDCDLRSNWSNDIEADIARLLAEGHTVARLAPGANLTRFPTSQCCVFVPATTIENRQRLLKRLGRPAFASMVTAARAEDAQELFLDAEKRMPAALDCVTALGATPAFQARNPAAISSDGTALVRLVSRDNDGGLHQLLGRYRERTGSSVLLMTDLATADEPPVSLPRDAMRVFLQAEIDYLALGNFLVEGSHLARMGAPIQVTA